MAYVPGYDNDIFVSYAHADDYCLSGEKCGWVTKLVKLLEPCIDTRLGSRGALKLWMDHELEAGHPITPQLLGQVQRTAIILVILSPSYINSPWCKRERENYLDVIRKWESRRVFIIEPEVVDLDDRPEELRDLKSFQFWVPSDHEGGAPCRLGTTRDVEDEFKKRVFDVSYALAKELRRMRAADPIAAPEKPNQGRMSDHVQAAFEVPNKIVFLAQVADDLQKQRDSVKQYLEQQRFTVVPDDLYWSEPQAFREAVERDLKRADLFVQLLSALSPRKPKGLPEGYLRCQHDLAIAAGKPVLQWRDPQLDPATIEDTEHRAFLESETLTAESLEDFKMAIVKVLTKPPQQAPILRTNVQVFVARDQADQFLAEEICAMIERCDAGWSRSLLGEEGEDPQIYRQDMEDRIKESDAIIVVYGRATALWVRRQLGELRKKLAEFNKQVAALAVFEGPPEAKLNIEAKPIPYMRTVNCRHGVCEDDIRGFLEDARRLRSDMAGVA